MSSPRMIDSPRMARLVWQIRAADSGRALADFDTLQEAVDAKRKIRVPSRIVRTEVPDLTIGGPMSGVARLPS